jgi:hypothetical protein
MEVRVLVVSPKELSLKGNHFLSLIPGQIETGLAKLK